VKFFRRPGVPDSELIPARRQAEAEERFTRAMNQGLGYVTRAGQWRAARPQGSGLWTLLLQPDETIPLPRDQDAVPWYLFAYLRFGFEVDERPGLEGGTKAVTREYIYSLRVGRDEAGEVIAWHWHPGIPAAPDPHVHVRATHPDVPTLSDLHIPTSRVFFEDVLLFAIRNLGVRCQEGGRENLEEMRLRTVRYASWR
jgi:hypothetical protein